MKILNKAFIPLLLALIGLGAVIFMLPLGVEAHQEEPNTGDIPLNPQVLGGTDIELSNGTNASLPEIAASNTGTAVAMVYEKGNQIFLRWAQTISWSNNILIDSVRGGTPKVAFLPGSTDTVHVVWSGYGTSGAVNGLAQKAIRHVRCTMTVEPDVTCGAITNVASTSFVTTALRSPDIAIDSSGRLHVAWFENPFGGTPAIKTRGSTAPHIGTTWGAVAQETVSGGSNAGQPALATSGNNVHLIYRDVVGNVQIPPLPATTWQIEYRRSSKDADPHVWGTAPDGGPFNDVLNHEKVSNPVIAAGGANVFMAWDTQNIADFEMYGLIGAVNTTNGNSNAWDNTRDITSTNIVDGAAAPTDRRSKDSAAPSVENELRPSIALTGTNDFVIVWQERHDQSCPGSGGIGTGSHLGENGTSEIYYAESHSNGWGTLIDTLSNNVAEYSIDPDIAIDSQGRRHIVFMKSSTGIGSSCDDGGASLADYAVYYRGPVTQKWAENPVVYLPIIVKN